MRSAQEVLEVSGDVVRAPGAPFHRRVTMSDRDLLLRASALAADHESGASTLAKRAVAIFLDAHEAGADLEPVVRAVCDAQPSMALVWHAAAVALAPGGVERLRRLQGRLTRSPAVIARLFADLIMMDAPRSGRVTRTVATVSASGVVKACLEVLSARTALHVICGEGRPMYEGRQMAVSLASVGANVTVCTDAAIASAVTNAAPGVDAVVVGADAVTPLSVVNKCGTHLLAAAASGLGIPAYVVACGEVFVGARLGGRLSLGEGPSEEVWPEAPCAVRVVNPYFERVPVDLFAAFVTEAGVIGSGLVDHVCASSLASSDIERLLESIGGIDA